jgi:hypothetical protein
MKCAVCGYEDDIPFKRFVLTGQFPTPENNIAYACPKCGVIQIKIDNLSPFSGCQCPWCGNIKPDNFNIIETRKPESESEKKYSIICSCCGAQGPDAPSSHKAVEVFKKLNSRALEGEQK